MPDALFGALLSNVYCQATNQRLSHEMSIATKNKDGKIFEILAKQTDAVRTFLGQTMTQSTSETPFSSIRKACFREKKYDITLRQKRKLLTKHAYSNWVKILLKAFL